MDLFKNYLVSFIFMNVQLATPQSRNCPKFYAEYLAQKNELLT